MLSIGNEALKFVLSAKPADFGCVNGVIINRQNILRAPTPLWQLSVTDCSASFPAGDIVNVCSAVCDRKYVANQTTVDHDQETTVLRWQRCQLPNSTVSTLDIEVRVHVKGATSTWEAVVGKANAVGQWAAHQVKDRETRKVSTESQVHPADIGVQRHHHRW